MTTTPISINTRVRSLIDGTTGTVVAIRPNDPFPLRVKQDNTGAVFVYRWFEVDAI